MTPWYDWPLLRRLTVRYQPRPEDRGFLARCQTQSLADLEVSVAVLDSAESRRYFGVPLARRGIQPVWLDITNRSNQPYRLHLIGIDPNYYPPLEAAAANHFSSFKRLLGFGLAAWLFLPLLLLLPLKVITAWLANQRMDDFFRQQAFRLKPVLPGQKSQGFVFTSLDIGSKVVHVKLMGSHDLHDLVFTLPVPGLAADYQRHQGQQQFPPEQLIDCDLHNLSEHVLQYPAATTNRHASRHGDPVNLVVAGDFPTVLSAFGARWDETEVITLTTCWKTVRSFLTGQEYRYSPVSALYLFGRSQDFALQRARHSINERLHLRLWATPLRFRGTPVWVGQVSRDIGVRLTHKTWNLTTHRIDPDVDEARDYVMEDLLEAQRLEMVGYIDGQRACTREAPRHNLTGDPYYTDGKIAAVLLAKSRTEPQLVSWF